MNMIPGQSQQSDQESQQSDQEGVLSPEQVAAERERVLNEREAELNRREKLLNQAPTQRAASEAEARDQAIIDARKAAKFYCPGCGKPSDYQRECVGTGTAPHPAVAMVSTDELNGDPANHTAAP